MPINNLPEANISNDYNLFLPKLKNQTLNAGTAHILRHRSVASELFGNRWNNKVIHYGDTIVIRYNQWQDELNKLRPNMSHKDLTNWEDSSSKLLLRLIQPEKFFVFLFR